MPEGDTIHRTASRLGTVARGQEILRARSGWPGLDAASLAGRRVESVEARGKHLLLHLEDGRAVHSHLGMTGAWHVYGRNEPWQKPASRAGLVLELAAHDCVCFSPKLLELLTASGLRRHPQLQSLGQDLLGGPWDEREAVAAFRRHGAAAVGVAVLDQTIVCGIGNVYKSELLFLNGICPLDPVGRVADEAILRLLRSARVWLARNLDRSTRQTRFALGGPRHWVYGRGGQPCLRCGARIRVVRQGEQGRTTYWCPGCQPAAQ
jgi:endonuclease-8